MNHKRKSYLIAVVSAMLLLLGGCALKPSPSTGPSSLPATQSAPAMATESVTPGVSVSSEIPPETENFLRTYRYEDVVPFNKSFADTISTDMDGDGQDDVVTLKIEAKEIINGIEYFTSLRISINNHEMILKADPGWNYGNGEMAIASTMLDIDEKDGIKELAIETQNNYEANGVAPESKVILITFDGSQPNILTKLEYWPEATGTGYITAVKYSKNLAGGFTIALQSFERYNPGLGFEEVRTDFMRALSYTSFAPEEYEGYPTFWDQAVAKKPGEAVTGELINKGTPVYFGLYHSAGWIELHDQQGITLGWLDLNKVNIDEYTGYALQATCH